MLDPVQDNVRGISLQKAYSFLETRKPVPVIVAVIDGGIDTAHEDLKNVLWINKGEIAGNGIDDDHNGYVDDIHGWNFLGNKDGSNLTKDNSERTRIYYRFREKFENKEIDTNALSFEDKWQYAEWKKAAEQMNISADEQFEVMMLEMTSKSLKKQDEVLRNEMQKEEFTRNDVEKFEPHTSKCKQAKMAYITFLHLLNIEGDETNTNILKDLQEFIDGKKASLNAKSAKPEDYRAEIIRDNYSDFKDCYYGNNDVMGSSADHGTHVSGIIAAQRNNETGIDGIANDVQIMMLRAVPDGDEYDKDIALAIRYAVDNGAKIINMSFGKSFSPDKHWVDEAIAYAESKDVLLVHAAGNESWNVDVTDNFPNANLSFVHKEADNFINVGASGDEQIGDGKLIADFSNYGAQTVDVFAPGVKIYSTM
ncbi:MAG TPA: S8 family serine peptidase, partial [Chitinophagaceae bacterium]|nr:S8 family serine peptidase [Chitinophagaceae bacterium]